MIRRICIFMLLVFAAATLPAAAQYEVDDKSRLGIRIGMFRPSDSVLRDVGNMWIGPVMDWNRKFDKQDRATDVISAAFFTADDGPVNLRSAPVTYSRLRRFSDSDRTWYAGGGAGLQFIKYSAVQLSDSAIRINLNLIVGFELSPYYFAEYRYSWAPKWEDINWSGSALHLGLRTSF